MCFLCRFYLFVVFSCFFFKQKTAYEMRISDWSSDVCSSDLLARIEMHLKAVRDTAFSVGGAHFSMRAGETIHTENSHKYGPRGARLLLNAGGWMPIREWTDADGMFCLLLAEAKSKALT